MTIDSPLAARRKLLVAQCGLQRMNVENDVQELLAPLRSATGVFGSVGGVGGKLPLTIASVVLGLLAARGSRALPLLKTGFSVWRIVRTLRALLRAPKE